MTELFKGARIPLDQTEGATMSFFKVETTGDCALSVKPGKEPRPMFELRIELDWNVEQPVDNGKSIAEAKGHITVTEFSSEAITEPQMQLRCDNKLPPGATPAFQGLVDKLNAAVKESGLPEVSRMLAEDYVSELKRQRP
uniref:Activator of Hsp90 ATPase AHSA1-like N-terminal domain-containing protein n=1 Tax=Zooxanthella nutricula TaxID=1333877 RepID=A0A7S2JP99_9DINO